MKRPLYKRGSAEGVAGFSKPRFGVLTTQYTA